MDSALAALVQRVNLAREAHAAAAVDVASIAAQYPEVYKLARDTKEEVEKAEGDLRAAVVAAWEASDKKSKAIAPGLGIREEKIVAYDPFRALNWCIDHGFLAYVQVNAKAFETFAVAAGDAVGDLVTVTLEAKATLAKALPSPVVGVGDTVKIGDEEFTISEIRTVSP